MSMRRQKFLLFRVYRFRDTGAYAQLYDEYYQRIRRYIYFKVPRSEDADELTSEVFLRGWEYGTSSRVENAGALFYRIARNIIADFYRSREEVEELKDQRVASSEDAAQDLMIKEEHAQLMNLMRRLKEEYQDVLVMRFLDEMSVKEISIVLEKTPNNVRVLLHRAKKSLQELTERSN